MLPWRVHLYVYKNKLIQRKEIRSRLWDLGEWQQRTVQSKQWQIWNENTKIVIIWTIIALKYWYNISQEYENPPVYKFRNMTHLITSDKLIKVATTMSNFDSWWLPVTTSCVVDIVLWRPSFHWNLTALSGSLHTSKAQQKVGPSMSAKTYHQSMLLSFRLFLGGRGDLCQCFHSVCVCFVLFFCCKLLQSVSITYSKPLETVDPRREGPSIRKEFPGHAIIMYGHISHHYIWYRYWYQVGIFPGNEWCLMITNCLEYRW